MFSKKTYKQIPRCFIAVGIVVCFVPFSQLFGMDNSPLLKNYFSMGLATIDPFSDLNHASFQLALKREDSDFLWLENIFRREDLSDTEKVAQASALISSNISFWEENFEKDRKDYHTMGIQVTDLKKKFTLRAKRVLEGHVIGSLNLAEKILCPQEKPDLSCLPKDSFTRRFLESHDLKRQQMITDEIAYWRSALVALEKIPIATFSKDLHAICTKRCPLFWFFIIFDTNSFIYKHSLINKILEIVRHNKSHGPDSQIEMPEWLYRSWWVPQFRKKELEPLCSKHSSRIPKIKKAEKSLTIEFAAQNAEKISVPNAENRQDLQLVPYLSSPVDTLFSSVKQLHRECISIVLKFLNQKRAAFDEMLKIAHQPLNSLGIDTVLKHNDLQQLSVAEAVSVENPAIGSVSQNAEKVSDEKAEEKRNLQLVPYVPSSVALFSSRKWAQNEPNPLDKKAEKWQDSQLVPYAKQQNLSSYTSHSLRFRLLLKRSLVALGGFGALVFGYYYYGKAYRSLALCSRVLVDYFRNLLPR